MHETLEGVVAIDGKTLRRSFDTGSNRATIHMISAWACEACDQKLVPGQRKIDDKSNEITAIPGLLTLLALKGAIMTIDAMGCQRRICRQIIDQQADYVIGLKGNQGSLRDDVELFPDEHPERDIGGEFIEESEAVDADHGRIETRRYTVCSNVEWLTDRHKWPGLPGPKAVIRPGTHVRSQVKPKRSGNYISHPLYISFFLAFLLRLRKWHSTSAITGRHWQVENCLQNCLHRVLDVTFRQDDCRIRTGNAAANFATINHAANHPALNLLRRAPGKISLPQKRRSAASHDTCMETVIRQ